MGSVVTGALATSVAVSVLLYPFGQVFSGTKNYLGTKIEPAIVAISPALDRYLYDGPPVVVPRVAEAQPPPPRPPITITGSLQGSQDSTKSAPASQSTPVVAKHVAHRSYCAEPIVRLVMDIGRAFDRFIGVADYRDDC